MSAAKGTVAAGALVGDDDGDGAPGADGAIRTPHLVARAAAFPVLEQHRAHSAHPTPQRPYVHQRSVSARTTCAFTYTARSGNPAPKKKKITADL